MDELPKDFLVYLYDPTDPREKLRLFLLGDGEKFSEIEPKDLADIPRKIISYELSALVDCNPDAWLRCTPKVTDIDIALTLAAEQPRREAQALKSFSFLDYLQSISDPEIEVFISYCFRGDRTQNEPALLSAIKKVATHLRTISANVFAKLQNTNGLRRLTNVEVPVSKVMHQRQALGLRVDVERIRFKISELANISAKARYALRKNYSILDPSDRAQVASVIQNDDLLSGVIDAEEYEWREQSLLKLYAQISPLAAELRKYREAQKSMLILQRLGTTDSGRVHPDYRIAGTITGRIIVRNPSLQNLSRTCRDVVIADEGMTLLYPDFKQCEPGIMAYESQDAALTVDYNSGDLYTALSLTLFDDEKHRSSSKLLFLFVCYGMSSDRVAKVGSAITGQSESKVRQAITTFFGRYPGIEIWRNELMAKVTSGDRVGTPCGNFRSFPHGTNLGAMLRGAQSQRIQGTAALILKEIIIEIEDHLPDVGVLLPMHDALLVQVPTGQVSDLREEIERTFCNVYRKHCPTIMPKVSFENFQNEYE